jgi:hypothetical protein
MRSVQVLTSALTLAAWEFPELVPVGEKFTLRLAWDAFASQFVASLNGGPDVVLPFTAVNAGPPNGQLTDVRIQHLPANCVAAGAVTDASVEIHDVKTNAGAVVP